MASVGSHPSAMASPASKMKVDPSLDDSAGKLSFSRAEAMARSTWDHCLRFLVWVEPGLNRDELEEEFTMWWASEGMAVLSMRANQDSDDIEEEDDLEKEEEPDEVSIADDKGLAILQSVEDHVQAKAELEAMQAVVSAGGEATEEPRIPESDSRSFLSCLKQCTDLELFTAVETTSSMESCLKRQVRLTPMLLDHVRRTRLREGVLSQATLTGETKYGSDWHRKEHQLALAPEVPDVPGQTKLWTHQEFSHTLQGTREIQRFMRELPALYQKADISLLDGDSVQLTPSKRLCWEEVALRTPDALDLMLDKTVGPKYGKAVLQAFMQILPKPKPDDAGSVAKVIQFVQRVDYLATPVQGSQKPLLPHAETLNPKMP